MEEQRFDSNLQKREWYLLEGLSSLSFIDFARDNRRSIRKPIYMPAASRQMNGRSLWSTNTNKT